MQATPQAGMCSADFPPEIAEMMRTPVPYEEVRMMRALDNPGVAGVRVFRKKRKKRNNISKASRRANR